MDTDIIPEPDDHPAVTAPKMVGAVVKAIEILRFLSETQKPHGVTAIARKLKINASTCFNTLRTLAVHDLVEFDHASRTYRIGLGVAILARGAFDPARSLAAARVTMAAVAREHEVTVSLWRRTSEARMTLIGLAEDEGTIALRMDIGQRLPVLGGAIGRVMGAFAAFEPALFRALFDKVRWHQPMSFANFQTEVARTQETGWSADHGMFVRGALTIAVPVRVGTEIPALVLCGSLLDKHTPRSAVPRVARALAGAAGKIALLPGLR